MAPGEWGREEHPRAAVPAGAPLLTSLHTLKQTAGEEGHGHEQDDGAAHDGRDYGHLEAEGLVWWHSCERQPPAPNLPDPRAGGGWQRAGPQ